MSSLMNRYQYRDRNADGYPLIISLSFLCFEQGSQDILQTATKDVRRDFLFLRQ